MNRVLFIVIVFFSKEIVCKYQGSSDEDTCKKFMSEGILDG